MIVKAVTDMIKSRSNVLQKSRVATDAEIKSLELSLGRSVKKPQYIQEDIAIIVGLDVLYEEYDLKNLVIHEIEEKIKSFKKLNIDNLTHSELAIWAKWVSSVESTKDKVKVSMQAGINLLKSSNLYPFKEILSEDDFIKLL